jgi:hypothetical protein
MRSLFCVCLAMALAGCTTTDFRAFDDGGRVYVGEGGSKELVKGVEIWSDGRPPRPYRVLGMIYDSRAKAVVPMATFRSDIAAAVKKHGGDAAIILDQGVEYLGSVYIPGSASTHSSATATRVGPGQYQISERSTTYRSPGTVIDRREQVSKVAVIRYAERD